MDHKEAIDVLLKLSEKKSLSDKEKKAVLTAIGILDWVSRAKSQILAKKARIEKSTKW